MADVFSLNGTQYSCDIGTVCINIKGLSGKIMAGHGDRLQLSTLSSEKDVCSTLWPFAE
jgi:hypothetical protein